MTTPFAREATGIVRSFSSLDTFILTTFGISYGVSLALTLVAVPSILPGANIGVAVIAALPFVLGLGLLYTWFTESMPRSGGDYVWISRAIHPVVAMAISGVWVFFQGTFVGAATSFIYGSILGPGLGTLGLLTGNSWLTSTGASLESSNSILILGLITILLTLVVLILPLRVFLRIQLGAWVLGMISVVLFFVIFATSSHAQFISTYNSYFSQYNSTYSNVISSAASSGFSNPGVILFGSATGLAVVYAIFAVNGYQFGGYVGGEIRGPRKGMYYSAIIGALIIVVVLAAGGYLVQNVLGGNFLNSIEYLIGTGSYSVPFSFNGYFVAILLNGNIVVGVLLVIGLFAWAILPYFVAGILLSRVMMAWGFDRAAPSALSHVNNRFHVPDVGVVVYVILATLGLLLSLYYGFFFANVNFILVIVLLSIIVGIAGIVFPYTKKDLFRLSPISKHMIGGIPLLSLLGVFVTLSFSVFAYYLIQYPQLSGPTGPTAFELLAGAFIVAILMYVITRAYYKSKGLAVDLVFKEIPPE